MNKLEQILMDLESNTISTEVALRRFTRLLKSKYYSKNKELMELTIYCMEDLMNNSKDEAQKVDKYINAYCKGMISQDELEELITKIGLNTKSKTIKKSINTLMKYVICE